MAGVVLHLVGALPSGLSTVLVLLVASIGLRIFVGYASKSASSAHRARITKLIAMVGFAVSLISVFAALPVLTRGGGSDHLIENLFAHLWTIVILLLVVGTARTLNWLTLIGLGLTSFLGVTGLAYAAGRPVVEALGPTSEFASTVFAPFTEEVLKALPALLILIFAGRRSQVRPSAVEMALVGAVLGSGFAVYEDAQFHRGGFDFGAMPIVSLINPTATDNSTIHVTYFGGGHMVYTSLISFGLAIGILYRRRFRWAKLAIPVTFAVAVLEHCTENYGSVVAIGRGNSGLFTLLRLVTLWGWLSTLMLVGGIVWLARAERRATAGGLPLKDTVASSFWLRPDRARRAAAALAKVQVPAGALAGGRSR